MKKPLFKEVTEEEFRTFLNYFKPELSKDEEQTVYYSRFGEACNSYILKRKDNGEIIGKYTDYYRPTYLLNLQPVIDLMKTFIKKGKVMYKITIARPAYLENTEYITPDSLMVSEFIQDKIDDLSKSEDKNWRIEVTRSEIGYLGEVLQQ